MNHPCHRDQVTNLKRIEGQVRGVQNMIDEGQYCINILNQIKAVRNALTRVEGNILKRHLETCLKESLDGENAFEEKVDELLQILKR